MFFQEGAVVNTWQQQFGDHLVNTFGAIRSQPGLKNNATVGQFLDALNTNIINALAIRVLCGTVCEYDGATVVCNLQSLFRAPEH